MRERAALRAARLRIRGPLVRTAFRADRLRSEAGRCRAAWRDPSDIASTVSVPHGCRDRALYAARERAAWDWVLIRVRAALRAAVLLFVFIKRMSRARSARYASGK